MAFVQQETNGVTFHASTRLAGVPHGFSTRWGGVSEGIYASMNLRVRSPDPAIPGDDQERVLENYRRFCAAVGIAMPGLALSRQVHKDGVREITPEDAGYNPLSPVAYEADALVTHTPGLSLMIFSADCIPVLLYDPVTGCIGAAHAGWRGTALDLPAKTVQELVRRYGARPEDLRAAIGPGIGSCCFETRGDVPHAMTDAFGSEASHYMTDKGGGQWLVDLKGLNAWRLREAGVRNIDVCPLCTACHPEWYWSHRKQGNRRGVQGAVIGLPPQRGCL